MSRSATNTFSSVSNIINIYEADNLPQHDAGEDFYGISEILSVFLHVFENLSVTLHPLCDGVCFPIAIGM